ncbi:MAG TPA: TIGR03667 family PPOX class F420-dependent oxidoreductase [Candidatus Dormibacteraeota bacterium]|nr:TIGR03667 family PPOX class F420-dependent oxidoreductase [Candidatus Dormibacteraeota bacterium]
MGPLIDTTTEFGLRAAKRLREDSVGWLVTVSSDGTPQPNPVWFSWDGESILVYSKPGQAKLRNIEANPRVALHLDSRSHGDDIVIVIAGAAIDRTARPVHQNAPYVTKYRSEMARLGLGRPEEMAGTYSVAVRLVPSKVRGF